MALWILLGILAAFVAVLCGRAAMFRPGEEPVAVSEEPVIDEERAVNNLRELIRCKTVSYRDKSREEDGEFEKLIGLLPELYPHVYEACEAVRPGKRSLVYHWKGRTPEKPGVLMAHFDVVPVNEKEWSKPAFEGILEDGFLWGRGTLDTKATFAGALEAVNQLIGEGFVPAHDLYLCFAGDEEISGEGAPVIVDWLEGKGIRPDFVLDEGGAVVSDVFPGVKQSCAVVGIAEKGPMDVKLTLKTAGGHASTPPPHTPVGILAKAVANIENHPFPFTLTDPALKMFDALGRRSTFVYRLIFANLWCFGPVLNLICKKSGGELNALVRTTVAFTQMQGGAASNVLPPEAWVGANLRLIPGETVEGARQRLQKLAGDERIRVEVVYGDNPSAVSTTDGEPWQRLEAAIRETWKDTVVSPYLMLACSDSRRYCRISDHVYRFSAMALSKEERGLIHGNDERIPTETIGKTVKFYIRLIQKC